MLELGSRQNMTGMETKRARGKCIANALVCQLCWTFLSQNIMGFCSDSRPTARKNVGEFLYALHTYYSCISTRLPEIIYCSVKCGLRTPNLGEGEAVACRGWYCSKERWWVAIGRPYPLSLRVSEILPLLFSSMTLFPYPTSSLPKISQCSPESRWIAFRLQRAKVLG